jgi:hypothetical protein
VYVYTYIYSLYTCVCVCVFDVIESHGNLRVWFVHVITNSLRYVITQHLKNLKKFISDAIITKTIFLKLVTKLRLV